MNISSVIQSDTISLATKMCYQFSVFFFSCSKPVRLSLSYFFLIFFIISDNCMRSCTRTAAIAVAVAIAVLLMILFACGVLTNKMCGITGKLLTLVLVKRWWKTSSPASSVKYFKYTDVCRVFVFIGSWNCVATILRADYVHHQRAPKSGFTEGRSAPIRSEFTEPLKPVFVPDSWRNLKV